jgi:hypothetical protein
LRDVKTTLREMMTTMLRDVTTRLRLLEVMTWKLEGVQESG